MKRIALFLLFLFFCFPPAFAAQSLIDRALQGKVVEEGGMTIHYLERRVPLAPFGSGNHEMSYFAVITIGGAVAAIETTDEKWIRDAGGNWGIDQWIFIADPQTGVVKAVHRQLVERPGGRVLSDTEAPSAGAAQVLERTIKLFSELRGA